LVESADAGGYSLPAEVVDAWRVFEQVRALPLPAPPAADFEEVAAGVVAAVADGKPVDVVKAGTKLHRVGDEQQVHAMAQRVLVAAVEQAGVAAANVAADSTDVIITEHLAPALGEISSRRVNAPRH